MQAHEAIDQIFKQSGWAQAEAKLSSNSVSSTNRNYDSLLMQATAAYRVDLTQFTLDLAIFNQEELFCSCQLLDLTEISKHQAQYFELLKKASAMVAVVNLDHSIKLVLHDSLLCLETVIDLRKKEPIVSLSTFLDDCDYFFDNAIKPLSLSSTNTLTPAPNLTNDSALTSQQQFNTMSPSLQFFLGVTP